MKLLFFIIALFISILAVGQSPYVRLNNEFRKLLDQIPVDNGQEQQFFDFALKRFEQDSLRTAGQIFDRVYWLDTTSALAKQSLLYRKKIEEKVIFQTQENLNNNWNWRWTGTGWGASDSSVANKRKRLQLDGNTIKFYVNDSLTRQTKYVLTQYFDWVNGLLINLVRYSDTNEEWYFNINSFHGFTSDGLWIQKRSGRIDDVGEAYRIEKKTTAKKV